MGRKTQPHQAAANEVQNMGNRGLPLRLALISLATLLFGFVLAKYGLDFEAPRARNINMAVQLEIQFPDLYEASIAELQDGMSKGLFTSVDLVKVTPVLSNPVGN